MFYETIFGTFCRISYEYVMNKNTRLEHLATTTLYSAKKVLPVVECVNFSWDVLYITSLHHRK